MDAGGTGEDADVACAIFVVPSRTSSSLSTSFWSPPVLTVVVLQVPRRRRREDDFPTASTATASPSPSTALDASASLIALFSTACSFRLFLCAIMMRRMRRSSSSTPPFVKVRHAYTNVDPGDNCRHLRKVGERWTWTSSKSGGRGRSLGPDMISRPQKIDERLNHDDIGFPLNFGR